MTRPHSPCRGQSVFVLVWPAWIPKSRDGSQGPEALRAQVKDNRSPWARMTSIIPEDVARERGGRMGDGVEDTHGGKSSVGVLETLDKLNFALLDGSGDSC